MTEPTLLPPPDEPQEAPGPMAKPQRRSPVPWLYGLGFLVLAAAIFYLWQYPALPVEASGEAAALQAVQQRLADIDARLGRLEQRPNPDLGKINARLDTLDGRVGDQTQLASRMDTLSGRIESLSRRDQTGIDAAKQQLDALASRIGALDTSANNVDAVTARLNRLAKLQEASLALAVGRPIGDLANAPEALVRFAHTAPPTEADLRLGFPRARQAALAAQQPDATDASFVDRILERAQGLVTIRRGDEIVVGNPAATILNQAHTALDAGDLAGAVGVVETLKGQPREAMSAWLGHAHALLNARAALAELAEHA
jgi:hypothetical protein